MINLIYIVAPIFLVIFLGYVLNRSLVVSEKIWNELNKLTYWVLFPALLFNKTSVIDFDGYSVGNFSMSMMTGFIVAVVFSFFISKIYRMNGPTLSSVIQGSGRHNSFLALAIISQLLGNEGEMIGALAVAVMVTFSNFLTIIFMISILAKENQAKPSVISEVFRNPFIVSIAIGLVFNFMGWRNLPILHDFSFYLGKAALPLALICVGAGLQFVGSSKHFIPCMIACFAKMILLPLTVFIMTKYFDLVPIMATSAVIFASVPTSSTAYALAKYMGGDAPLMATIISLQTLLAVITIPVIILFVS